MPERDWDRQDSRNNQRRGPDRDRGSWTDDRRREWESNRYYDAGDQSLGDRNRENRDWHNDRDWRSRNYNRDYDSAYNQQDRSFSDRNFDTRQYSNQNYIGRDYGREDRYRDDQNRDWEHHRGESSRDRDRHTGHQGFEHGSLDDAPSSRRYITHQPSDYKGSRYDWDRNRNINSEADYSRNWGAQAFGNGGIGFGAGLPPTGGHVGRGPKNWQRSDDRIREDVNEELTRNPDVDATEIDVSVSAAEVTLTGTVDDRHEKREAEECAWRVSGVKDVHNNIKVGQGLGSRIVNAFKGDSSKE